MAEIPRIGPVSDPEKSRQTHRLQPNRTDVPSFKDTMKGFLSDVNSMQLKADESIQKMASGEITDVHQVLNAVEEAKTAFNMMMEIRNKVMDAYSEVIRMRL